MEVINQTVNGKYIKSEILELIVALVITLIFAGLIPVTLGLGFHGFENPVFVSNFEFYIALFVVGGGLVVLFKIATMFKQDKVFCFIHDPDKAIIPVKYNPLKNPLIMIIVAFLISVFFGLLLIFSHQQNVFGTTAQQLFPLQTVSKVASLYFGAEPAATTETWVFAGIMFLIITILNLTVFRNSKGWQKWLLLLIIPFIMGGSGWLYHQLRYPGDDPALAYTFWFWTITSFLALLFGSLIIMWIPHLINNLMGSAVQLAYSNDTILVFIIIILVVIGVPSIFYLIRKSLNRRRK